MSHQFEVEDFPVREPNHEEDMKRPKQNPSDADKIATPSPMPDAWRSRQRGDGPRLGRMRIYSATVLTETSNPNTASDESLQATWNGRTTTPLRGETIPTSNVPSSPVAASPELSRTISNGLRQPPTCQNPKAPFGVAQARIRQGQLCHHASLVCKHDTPALNLLDVETHQRFAMWAVYGKRADGSEPKAWIVAAKCCFLKCN
jgi:hypothetical protein